MAWLTIESLWLNCAESEDLKLIPQWNSECSPFSNARDRTKKISLSHVASSNAFTRVKVFVILSS